MEGMVLAAVFGAIVGALSLFVFLCCRKAHSEYRKKCEGTIDDREQRLLESEWKYSVLVRNLSSGIVIRDPGGSIVYANPAFSRLVGADSVDDVTGKDYFEFVHPEDRAESVRRTRLQVALEGIPLREHRLVGVGGKEVVVESTGVLVSHNGRRLIMSLFHDVTERKKAMDLLWEKTRELELHQEAIVVSMAVLAEFRDAGTGNHLERTREYVRFLLERLNPQKEIPCAEHELVARASILHDIGKVGIPDAILLKPGPLTREEFDTIKTHPLIGGYALGKAQRILGEAAFLKYAREIVTCHHEKWDGSGYPYGLRGEAIPMSARIVALCDVYDALISERPYKKAFPHEEAVKIISSESGRHFAPELVRAFLENAEEFKAISEQRG
jgi:PAS domain S-box-containing protein